MLSKAIAGRQRNREQIAIEKNAGERVIEVVRHATGEAANDFHFLGLAEMFFDPAASRNVLEHGDERCGLMVVSADGGHVAPSRRAQRWRETSRLANWEAAIYQIGKILIRIKSELSASHHTGLVMIPPRFELSKVESAKTRCRN